MMTVTPTAGEPEYLGVSYELPLSCTIALGYRLPGEDPARRGSGSVPAGGRLVQAPVTAAAL